jgi:hypothetical protein
MVRGPAHQHLPGSTDRIPPAQELLHQALEGNSQHEIVSVTHEVAEVVPGPTLSRAVICPLPQALCLPPQRRAQGLPLAVLDQHRRNPSHLRRHRPSHLTLQKVPRPKRTDQALPSNCSPLCLPFCLMVKSIPARYHWTRVYCLSYRVT